MITAQELARLISRGDATLPLQVQVAILAQLERIAHALDANNAGSDNMKAGE